MADKKKMSVEDILAACRKGGDGGGAAAPSAKPAAPATEVESVETPANPEPAAAKPAADAAKPAAAKAKPGAMSVTDILAAARAGKAGGAAAAAKAPAAPTEPAKAAEAKPTAPKAPAAKTAPKPAAEKPAAAGKPAAVDTTSILAAARGAGKPGPVSKSELKEKPAEPAGKKKLEVPPMPAKPAYAQGKPAAKPEETRRGFLASISSMVVGSSMALGFASLAVTHLLWVLGLARYMFPNILTEPPTRFKVGFPDTLAPGQVDERFKAAFGVWIVRHEYEGQSQIFALKTVCTHLGCTPNWLESEQKFKCPCHGSGFYKEGINFEGPAPRPLERYAIRVADDGQLEVDKSRVFHEETGQWRDPASFVTA